jgi:hypothetical protein
MEDHRLFLPAIFVTDVLARLTNGAVELLQLAEDFLRQLDIALMQQGETSAETLIGPPQSHQLRLL